MATSARFIRAKSACELIGVSHSTLARYRRERLIEGTHYVRPNDKNVLYKRDELLHWFETMGDPDAHRRWLAERESAHTK
ncbi:MAG: hypothetical protein DDT26_00823 [Dehalococcoidia bacterium]|nr:hypothetical protein [Chloroflexota bacterium]